MSNGERAWILVCVLSIAALFYGIVKFIEAPNGCGQTPEVLHESP